jgi:hypothetical protein
VYLCVLYLSEKKTATCATYIINWSVFITEMESVYSAVRTGSLNKAVWASSLREAEHVSAALTEGLPWFFSIVRQMPGHKLMQRRGTARNPPPAWRPHLSAWITALVRQPGFKPQAANQPK